MRKRATFLEKNGSSHLWKARSSSAFISNVAHLDAKEEREMIKRAASGDQTARNWLITSHLPVIVHIAKRYRAYGVPMGDLIQEGAIGLMQAITRFNPNRGARLATYAKLWARSAMREYIVRSCSMVCPWRSRLHRNLFFHLRQFYASSPANGEAHLSRLSQRFGVSKDELLKILRRFSVRDISFDGSSEDNSFGDGDFSNDHLHGVIGGVLGANPEEELLGRTLRSQVAVLVRRALDRIPPREAFIVRGRFLSDPLVARPVLARKLGISKDRVRQLEIRALSRLRDLLPKSDLLLSP